jgi:hypothetical protein
MVNVTAPEAVSMEHFRSTGSNDPISAGRSVLESATGMNIPAGKASTGRLCTRSAADVGFTGIERPSAGRLAVVARSTASFVTAKVAVAANETRPNAAAMALVTGSVIVDFLPGIEHLRNRESV